jgi:hypothetical protein
MFKRKINHKKKVVHKKKDWPFLIAKAALFIGIILILIVTST